MNEFKRMQKLAGLITENEYLESLDDFKLIKKDKDTETYLLNDEDYTTPSGLEFNLKTLGLKLTQKDFPKFIKGKHNFFYVKTDVYYNGKQITKGDGIPGLQQYGWNINGSINKAKKWLDKNGDKLISGKGYQYKST